MQATTHDTFQSNESLERQLAKSNCKQRPFSGHVNNKLRSHDEGNDPSQVCKAYCQQRLITSRETTTCNVMHDRSRVKATTACKVSMQALSHPNSRNHQPANHNASTDLSQVMKEQPATAHCKARPIAGQENVSLQTHKASSDPSWVTFNDFRSHIAGNDLSQVKESIPCN